MRLALTLAAFAMAIALFACGGADYSGLSDEEVYEQAGIEEGRFDTGEGTYFEGYLIDGCLTDQVLRGEDAIDLFSSSGDQVVTTDDGELGLVVQVVDPQLSEDDCEELVSDALSRVKP